ncbi:MAG TPA: hypothetical protein VEY30_13230, partial [Myxococcaceae bacterium]|nr:hypothetical protein [Myxococcaceae bacterium]
MFWLGDRHVDRALARLGDGSLSPRQWGAVVNHARGCARCAGKYERAVWAQRTLERGSPWVPGAWEEAALEERGLK